MLADLRPNAAMLAEWGRLYGGEGALAARPAGFVSWQWREPNALAEGRIRGGPVADLEDTATRARLEERHAALLAERGMAHLDIAEVRSKDRIVTQSVGRSLYADGFGGIRFRSNIDDGECFALFEGRAWLAPTVRPSEPMTDDVPELLQAAGDFRLVLDRVWRPTGSRRSA